VLKVLPWLATIGIAWSLGCFYNVFYGGELSWLRKVYFEKIGFLDNIKAPQRIIFIGGSGVQYSIEAEKVERELGIQAFNFGLQGDLGLNVIFETILPKIRPNDIVVIVPEYLMLLDEDGFGKGNTLFGSGTFGLAIGKPGLGGVSLPTLVEDTWSLGVPGLPVLAKSAIDLVEKGRLTGYFSDPFTEKGDYTIVKTRVRRWDQMTIDNTISDHSYQRLQQFRQELEAKGAHLIIALSWVYVDTKDPATVKNVTTAAKRLAEIAPTLYNPETLNIKNDSSLFADTHYHLLPHARTLRTEELIKQLRPLIKSMPQSP
jgi:hypothetical protein